VAVKKINVHNTTAQLQVLPALRLGLNSIVSINSLTGHLELMSAIPYDNLNKDHEKLLLRLWSLLKPDMRLSSRISSEWGEIGFQGTDPATDFRGMGILGLYNLVEFAAHCPDDALRILGHCREGGLKWYSFAITGINLTNDLLQLTRDHQLDHYYFKYGASTAAFQALYCTIFCRFDESWIKANPVNVMEYSKIHSAFVTRVLFNVPVAHIEGYEFLLPLKPIEQFKTVW